MFRRLFGRGREQTGQPEIEHPSENEIRTYIFQPEESGSPEFVKAHLEHCSLCGTIYRQLAVVAHPSQQELIGYVFDILITTRVVNITIHLVECSECSLLVARYQTARAGLNAQTPEDLPDLSHPTEDEIRTYIFQRGTLGKTLRALVEDHIRSCSACIAIFQRLAIENHPDAIELMLYADNQLGNDRHTQISQHLANCTQCSGYVASYDIST